MSSLREFGTLGLRIFGSLDTNFFEGFLFIYMYFSFWTSELRNYGNYMSLGLKMFLGVLTSGIRNLGTSGLREFGNRVPLRLLSMCIKTLGFRILGPRDFGVSELRDLGTFFKISKRRTTNLGTSKFRASELRNYGISVFKNFRIQDFGTSELRISILQ